MSWKRMITIIVATVILAVYAYLGSDYMRQIGEQRVLAAEISSVEQALVEAPALPSDLEARLQEAQSALDSVTGGLASQASSTRAIDEVIDIARQTGVKLLPLSSQPWALELVGDSEYRVFRFEVTAEGDYYQVVDFVSQLETAELPSLVIEDIAMTSVDPTGQSTIMSSRVRLAIYARTVSG